jgi:hypothetical protein
VERRIEVLGAAHLELIDDVALLEPRARSRSSKVTSVTASLAHHDG